MHVVIGGYGRVGRYLAHMLEKQGHTVSAIDHDPGAFEEIGEISGQKLVGPVYDRGTLVAAGIERAGCFAAVTAGDNSNIVSARIAKETFGVANVVARIYDPRRAELYREMGIRTVSSVEWAASRILRIIGDEGQLSEYQFGEGEVEMLELEIPARAVEKRVADVETPGEIRIVAIVREHAATVPAPGERFRPGDRVYAAVASGSVDKFRALLGIKEVRR
ncbi:MAG: TrkA family potassium uptake protein [Actinobacteria bacterium]|nr:MAG: TrkA family potassium uptake protein [Actinomycetota bacterium]